MRESRSGSSVLSENLQNELRLENKLRIEDLKENPHSSRK
jgi:hypothetical protein